jgi:transaldolase/glucose-6-phosphate isomerase
MSDLESNGLQMSLGRFGEAVAARLRRWEAEDFGRRLWAKDRTLWTPEPVPELTDRMGWLELPEALLGTRQGELDALERFAEEARTEEVGTVFVLGMGGSSLAPEVFARTFGGRPGFPVVRVLDTTHPDAVEAASRGVDPAKTLFLVSSKSGGTIETLSFFRYFWKLCADRLSADRVGRRFVAITDPGTSLERLARERGFRAVFNAPEEVGGRYSAFTNFGLVPAALAGVDLRGLLERGRAMAHLCGQPCGPEVPAAQNPGLALGAALGELALAGRDKVTFVTTPSLESFPDWIEQLVAESTGKHGKGIVPVVGERPGRAEAYGRDRVFAALLLDEDREGAEALEARLAGFEAAGHPVLRFRCADRLDLGREIFRWELATAAAGAVLGINPFDQPDVQLAKELAARAMKQGKAEGTRDAAAGETVDSLGVSAVAVALGTWIEGIAPGDYIGLQAYLPPGGEELRIIQAALRDWTRLAVTAGYGPRFLHSTGQLHKGGPGRCRFLQLVSEPHAKVPVPETDYDFASLIRAQADGDRQALEQRDRKVLRLQLGRDTRRGLEVLGEALGAGAHYAGEGDETLPPEVYERGRR